MLNSIQLSTGMFEILISIATRVDFIFFRKSCSTDSVGYFAKWFVTSATSSDEIALVATFYSVGCNFSGFFSIIFQCVWPFTLISAGK